MNLFCRRLSYNCCWFWFAALLLSGIALQTVPTQADAPDCINLTLTYTERNGLSGPIGQGDMAGGTAQAMVGAANVMQSFKSLDSTVNDLLNGKQVNFPKTTGETMKQYTKSNQVSSPFPRNSGYQGRLQATLQWDEKFKAYVVQSGTFTWTTYNSSHLMSKGHEFVSNLTSSGTHQLKPKEVTIKFRRGRMSEFLGAKSKDPDNAAITYDLRMNIKPKPQPVLGTSGWIVGKGGVYEIQEEYSAKGVKDFFTDEYKPVRTQDGGSGLAATSHRGVNEHPAVMYDPKVSYKAEERDIYKGRAVFSENWTDTNGTRAGIQWSVTLPGEMVADPGGPYLIERGADFTLDGSNSRGKIDTYEWTLTSEDIEAKDPDTSHLEGKTADTAVLGNTGVKLKVKGKQGVAEATAEVIVLPRDFKTSYTPEGDGQAVLPVPRSDKESMVAGYNVLPLAGTINGVAFNFCGEDKITSLSEWEKLNHVFHFKGDRDNLANQWEDEAYTLKQFEKEGSPDKGKWYVEKPLFYIKRSCWFSPYFQEQGPIPFYPKRKKEVNWYNANLERSKWPSNIKPNFDPEAYRNHVIAHEKEHSERVAEYLGQEGKDPGLVIEKLFKKNKEELKEDVCIAIRAADADAHNYSKLLDLDPNMQKSKWVYMMMLWEISGALSQGIWQEAIPQQNP